MRSPRERKTFWISVGASVVVHLVAAFSLAGFHQVFGPMPVAPDQPMELTMVDLAATVPAPDAPVNPAYIDVDPDKETPEPPERKVFESHANAQAASERPAAGDLPLPTQEGRDNRQLDLETQRSSVAMEGSRARPEPPQPEPVPVSTPKPTPIATPEPAATPRPTEPPPAPTPLPEPAATPQQDRLAMLTSTPPPAFRDPEEIETPSPDMPPTPPPVVTRPQPESPATMYQREKQQTAISGSITNRGRSSVDAGATALGKFKKTVSDAIGNRWYYHIKQRGDLANVGTARIEAQLDPSGKLTNVRVVSNSSNEAFANICLQSFEEAQIPPIPPDLVATLPDGKLPLDFSFTYF